ncbi:MAG: flagellar basal body-associated FliL family protein [Hyphomicrobiaceae bacterium]|nr:flagellar basal body-associated FliL family protein [Hyphomicrobiaceae bacterium]MCC0024798.1 flagellar basal body-associated FliL family protein [Hyphomicrobiaceae bacterium]
MSDVAAADDNIEGVEGEGEAPAKKKLGKKQLIIIGGAAALVVALAGGAALFFLSGSGAAPADGAMVEAAAPTYFYDLPDIMVNLSPDESPEDHFLKLQVSLEVSDEAMVEVIGERVTRVLDAFQVYLRELRRSDLEGSAGIYRLKEELRRRVNLAVYPAQVDNILFREILVQ